MKNKRGLSDIVATLIIILLVIVAAGIIWVVVRGIVAGGAEEIELSQECFQVDIEFVSLVYNYTGTDTDYRLTLSRKGGGSEVAGVSLNVIGQTNSTGVIEFGALEPLDTNYTSIPSTGLDCIELVEWTPYFIKSDGNRYNCQTRSRAFINPINCP